MADSPARSRKVKKIVRLEARARRLLTRYERALSRATRAKAQAHALLDQASLLEFTLTGTSSATSPRARRIAPATPPTTPETLRPSMTSPGRTRCGRSCTRASGHVACRVRIHAARITPAKHRAQQCDQEAKALKVTLTPYEISQLRRARSGV
jgi:hypothetical protein